LDKASISNTINTSPISFLIVKVSDALFKFKTAAEAV
jgi:hypothetical protein